MSRFCVCNNQRKDWVWSDCQKSGHEVECYRVKCSGCDYESVDCEDN
jgi:hypothetical protein